MYTCPKCKRTFKNKNQDHSCGDFSIEKVFEKRPKQIYLLFKTILEYTKSLGDMQINAVKNGVMFSVNSTFLALKPGSKYLQIEFACGKQFNEFPVEKCVKVSKTEYAHILRIENEHEFDRQLRTWIKEAYNFNLAKN